MKTPIATRYGWESAGAEHSHSYLLESIEKIFSERARVDRLIDIGTGNGATLDFWKSNAQTVCAMEPDKDGFEFAQQQHQDVDIRRVGVGEAFGEDWEESFDCAVCLEVVEHLFNPEELAQTANRLLKPGGWLVVSTPYHGYLKNLTLSICNKWDFHHHPIRVGGHIKFWSKKTLVELFSEHGFKFLSFNGSGRIPLLWKSMICVFEKQ
tara:strand:- start:4879 stop:5505 length:627 start_codon:yes stop_codon:yes gene_type:complete